MKRKKIENHDGDGRQPHPPPRDTRMNIKTDFSSMDISIIRETVFSL